MSSVSKVVYLLSSQVPHIWKYNIKWNYVFICCKDPLRQLMKSFSNSEDVYTVD